MQLRTKFLKVLSDNTTFSNNYEGHFEINAWVGSTAEWITHGCANHDTEGKRFKFPHPLL